MLKANRVRQLECATIQLEGVRMRGEEEEDTLSEMHEEVW